ncbi:MAG: hypothetical protein IKF80_07660 [Erysipelotrichaceae bacterium]|nr:hypothetical protein [Erysipelotrichaceae bacterium]
MAEKKEKEIWKYKFSRDKISEDDKQKILQIWKDNPRSKVSYQGKQNIAFGEWAKQQGAKEVEDGYYSID